MQPMLRAGLCVLLLLAVTHPSATVHAAGGTPSGSDPDTAGGDMVSPIPGRPEPMCARPDAENEPCATRHPKEYREWQESVHGKAYLSGDADAPGCTECHDDPESAEIRTAAFRLSIPSRCAGCHGDEKLMRKHEIATDLYSSYLADYHGFTIDYYRTRDPSMWRYEAVCSDCHASHAIFGADASRSSVAPAKLLDTCRKCHWEVEANFTSTMAGHFRTSRDSSLLVYAIELIYRILIPVVIGLMLVYVGLDVLHRLRKKSAETR